ncbi:unnamed protein product [Symbiodinium sp. CCMP2592]|nr:unnamed protein product [Symbiodinium sp. CCMP2592]
MVWYLNQRRIGRRATCSPLPRRLPKGQHESGPSAWKRGCNPRSRSPLGPQRGRSESFFPNYERGPTRGSRTHRKGENGSPPTRERSPIARRRRCTEGAKDRRQNIPGQPLGPTPQFEEVFETRKEEEKIQKARKQVQKEGGEQRKQQQQPQRQQQPEYRLPGQWTSISGESSGSSAIEEDSRCFDSPCPRRDKPTLGRSPWRREVRTCEAPFPEVLPSSPFCQEHLTRTEERGIDLGSRARPASSEGSLGLRGCAGTEVEGHRTRVERSVMAGGTEHRARSLRPRKDQQRSRGTRSNENIQSRFQGSAGSRKRFQGVEPERRREREKHQGEGWRKGRKRQGGSRSPPYRADAPPVNHPSPGSPLPRRVGVGISEAGSGGKVSQSSSGGGQQSLSLEVGFTSDLMGRYLLEQVLGRSSSSTFGCWAVKSCERLEGLMAEGLSRKVDIFPLPLPMHPARALEQQECQSDDLWLVFLVLSLNYMHGGQHAQMSIGPGTDTQRGILEYLRGRIQGFTTRSFRIEPIDWKQFFQIRGISYSGEEVKVAKWTSWENVEPALPFGHIGSISAVDLADGGVRELLLDPQRFLKPGFGMEGIKSSKVMVRDEDWTELALGLVRYNLCCVLPESALLHSNGKPIHNGLFGVEKGEQANGHEIHRLIMNLIPINSASMSVEGDTGTLPLLSQMNSLELHPDEHLVVSSEDLRCMFYLFALPQQWFPLLSFNRPVPAELVPPHVDEPCYLCSKVLPMGYLNSVGIAQHLHRNLISRAQGGPTRCVGSAEVRKDRPASLANPLWRVYLDNFDLLEKENPEAASIIKGSISPDLEPILEEYFRWGIPLNSKKSVRRATFAEIQGAEVDGCAGMARPKSDKLQKYVGATLSLLRVGKATQKQMQVICGGLVYFAMFRRPLMSCLNYVWKFIHSFDLTSDTVLKIPTGVMSELLVFLGLLPLAHMDFRTSVSTVVTASDASNLGGGICASSGITSLGDAVASADFRGDSSIDVPDGGVVCIGLFDGISAMRVALEAIRTRVVLHVSAEIDPTCRRVVETHFPDVIHHDDVASIDQDCCNTWAAQASSAKLVLVGASPPYCKAVNSEDTESKSPLHGSVQTVISMLRSSFSWCPVHFIHESFFTMEDFDRQTHTRSSQVLPYRVCASGLSLCRRERLYWFDWGLQSEEGVVLHPPTSSGLSAYGEIRFECSVEPLQFLEKGWRLHSDSTRLPAFTVPQPSTTGSSTAAGIHRCTQVVKDRWASDRYRFPPFQYLDRHVLWRKDEARPPNARERERMLGFPVDFTYNCLNKTETKRSATHHEDTRLSLLGSTSSVPVLAFFFLQLLAPLGLCLVSSLKELLKVLAGQSVKHGVALLSWRALHQTKVASAGEETLVRKLLTQVSSKGEDFLVSVGASARSYQKFRNSIPASLWSWKEICGWKWSPCEDHINRLELRAIYTTIRWRVLRRKQLRVRFLHLTDSMVCLHVLNRGRSSSLKIQTLMYRLSSLVLATGLHLIPAYVSTNSNPADRPSRRARVRKKWAK